MSPSQLWRSSAASRRSIAPAGLSRRPRFERDTDRTAEFLEQGADLPKPIADLATRNMEAFVVFCKVAVRPAEGLAREATEYGRKTCEDAFAMTRSFAEVRSPADLIAVQTEFAKAAFENAMASSNNVAGTLTKMAGEDEGPSLSSFCIFELKEIVERGGFVKLVLQDQRVLLDHGAIARVRGQVSKLNEAVEAGIRE